MSLNHLAFFLLFLSFAIPVQSSPHLTLSLLTTAPTVLRQWLPQHLPRFQTASSPSVRHLLHRDHPLPPVSIFTSPLLLFDASSKQRDPSSAPFTLEGVPLTQLLFLYLPSFETDRDSAPVPLRVPPPKKGPPPPPLKPGRQSESAYSHSSNTTLVNNSSSRINSNIYASSTSLAAPQHRLNSPHDSLRSNHSDNNLTLLSSSPKSTYSRAHQQYDNTEYPSNRHTFKGVFSNIVSSMSGTKKSELTFLFPIPQLEHCFFVVVVNCYCLVL